MLESYDADPGPSPNPDSIPHLLDDEARLFARSETLSEQTVATAE
jgi:hypothetical protein